MIDRELQAKRRCPHLLLLALSAAALLCIQSPAHAVTYLQGIDVYTGDGTVNWNTLKTNGYTFAFVKATEGVNFVDAKFTANMTGAAAAGIYVGPYHFCRIESINGVPFTSYDGSPFVPGTDPYEDARTEARDFIKAILPYYQGGSYLPPVADVEGLPDFGNATLNKTFISNWLQVFSDQVKNSIGVRPMVYTSKSGANEHYTAAVAAEHSLWVAWWKGTGTTSPPLQSDTPLFSPWLFWQWSATGMVDGLPGSPPNGDVDKDVFYGSLAQLQSLLVHTVPGDYNHDGTVNTADYIVWRDTVGSTLDLRANGNNSGASLGVIDNSDYLYWKAHFGQTGGSGSGGEAPLSGTVPEPATLLLLCLGMIALLARSQKR